MQGEWGISSNDATHRLTTAIIFDFPIGRGRWLGRGMNRVLDGVVGGWSLYAFLTLQSGQPIAVYDATGLLADGNQRPDVVCSQLRTGLSWKQAAQSGSPYLNQNCFAFPGDNVPGNAPRHFSNLRGDGINNLDISLSKEFTIREGMPLQVRAEASAERQSPAQPRSVGIPRRLGRISLMLVPSIALDDLWLESPA